MLAEVKIDQQATKHGSKSLRRRFQMRNTVLGISAMQAKQFCPKNKRIGRSSFCMTTPQQASTSTIALLRDDMQTQYIQSQVGVIARTSRAKAGRTRASARSPVDEGKPCYHTISIYRRCKQ